MSTKHFLGKAAGNLDRAFERAVSGELPLSKINNLIELVINSTHKTYKYILFTAVLAKATDGSLNPLSLQAKAQVEGAYDARSLCHKVVVPFERKNLKKVLGGSNEPFLNKPARFQLLSPENAVRRGADKKLLDALCENLPNLENSEDGMEALVFLLGKLLEKVSNDDSFEIHVDSSLFADEYSAISQFIDSLLNFNSGGEILTVVFAAALMEFFKEDEYLVEAHNVNQSGASSHEVSDLDVYRNGKLFAAFELKDKSFSLFDVEHAVQKTMEAGFNKLNFVYGRSARFDKDEVEAFRQELLYDSFTLNVVAADPFIWAMLSIVADIKLDRMTQNMAKIAEECNFSKECTLALAKVAEDFKR